MAYTVVQTDDFANWLRALADGVAKKAIAKRLVRVEAGLFGDHDTVGGGVFELRLHIGPGYRLYYTIRNQTIVFVVLGGDKSTQRRDIAKAQEIAAKL